MSGRIVQGQDAVDVVVNGGAVRSPSGYVWERHNGLMWLDGKPVPNESASDPRWLDPSIWSCDHVVVREPVDG